MKVNTACEARSERPQSHRDTEKTLKILCVSVSRWRILRLSQPV